MTGLGYSLFRRATRYRGPENRLTEILATVLERVDAGSPIVRSV
jgi:hypothetical protein